MCFPPALRSPCRSVQEEARGPGSQEGRGASPLGNADTGCPNGGVSESLTHRDGGGQAPGQSTGPSAVGDRPAGRPVTLGRAPTLPRLASCGPRAVPATAGAPTRQSGRPRPGALPGEGVGGSCPAWLGLECLHGPYGGLMLWAPWAPLAAHPPALDSACRLLSPQNEFRLWGPQGALFWNQSRPWFVLPFTHFPQMSVPWHRGETVGVFPPPASGLFTRSSSELALPPRGWASQRLLSWKEEAVNFARRKRRKSPRALTRDAGLGAHVVSRPEGRLRP